MKRFRTGIGQDSHRFLSSTSSKACVIGGLIFEGVPGFQANSDGDVVFHAICNALSSLTGVLILGKIADELCFKDGITDSSIYLKEALKTLEGEEIVHVAISLEGRRPKFLDKIPDLRKSVAEALEIDPSQVGITATSGEGLNDVGLGRGVQCTALVTTCSL